MDTMEPDEKKEEQRLPLRGLHDFLFEIDREWSKFRTGSLLSMLTSLLLFVIFIPRFLTSLRRGGPVDRLFVLGIVAALLYNAYLAYGQHRFYSTWEKRLGLLLHLEEQLLGE